MKVKKMNRNIIHEPRLSIHLVSLCVALMHMRILGTWISLFEGESRCVRDGNRVDCDLLMFFPVWRGKRLILCPHDVIFFHKQHFVPLNRGLYGDAISKYYFIP